MNTKVPTVGADTNVAVFERLAVAVAAVQHTLSVCSVKGIRIVRFLRILLFIGFHSEIQGDGLRVEGKETDVISVARITTINK